MYLKDELCIINHECLGHVGPLALSNPTDGPRAVSTYTVADVGAVESVKVSNEAGGEWELESLGE